LELIRKFSFVTILHSKNISISNSRNIGANESNAENLVFIDSDCLVSDNLLLKAYEHLQNYECCGSFYKASEKHGWVAKTWLEIERKKDGLVDWMTGGTLIVRRDFFYRVGAFNESLQTEEDEEFAFSVKMNGGKIYNDSAIASVHLGQPDRITAFFKKEMWRGKSLIKSIIHIDKKKYGLFDLIIICFLLNLCLLIIALFFKQRIPLIGSIFLCFLLPLLFAIRKIFQIKLYGLFFQIFFLYLIFLLARSVSVFRYRQFNNLFKTGTRT
jgi:glycosyltransferase involved in cell wall biosynthesis